MLLIQVHKLHVKVGHAFPPLSLEDEGDNVRGVLRLHGDHIVVVTALEDLGEGGEVHAHGEVPIAPERLEPLRPQVQGHQGHVAVVHRLQLDPRLRA